MACNGIIHASMMLVILVISTCQSAPSFRPKSEWHEDAVEEAPTILTSNCDPVTGRCMDWLPLGDTRLDRYVVEQDAEFNR